MEYFILISWQLEKFIGGILKVDLQLSIKHEMIYLCFVPSLTKNSGTPKATPPRMSEYSVRYILTFS